MGDAATLLFFSLIELLRDGALLKSALTSGSRNDKVARLNRLLRTDFRNQKKKEESASTQKRME